MKFGNQFSEEGTMKKCTQQLIKCSGLVIFAGLLLAGCSGSEETPTTFFEGVKEASQNNDPAAVWNTLPASMQSEFDSLAHDVGNRMQAEFYDSSWILIRRISTLLETKKGFILNTPIVQMGMLQIDAEEKEQFITTYDSIVPAINLLA